MVAYVDAHCHLDLFPGIQNNPLQENTGSIKSLTVTNAPYLFEHNKRLFAACNHIRVALGFHPEALGDPRLQAHVEQQLAVFDAQFPAARYVGEVGLDGSSAWKETWPTQLAVLKHITAQCERTGNKIITAHSRKAVVEVLALLASTRMIAQDNRIILHWFSGTSRQLEAALAANVYFSINHRMLLTEKGRQAVVMMPLNRVLTETDAPFTLDATIATREQSLAYTLNQLSLLWQMPPEQARILVWQNFKRLLT